jgi:two-component system, LytTR family, response regulator
MKSVIIDDEIKAVERINEILTEDGRFDDIISFTQGLEALNYCKNQDVDIVFLDIDMPDMDGISFGRAIFKEKPQIIIVYVTAYDEYTMEAYNNFAFGYLLKPVSKMDIHSVIDLFFLRIQQNDLHNKNNALIQVQMHGDKNILYRNERIIFRTKKAEEMMYLLLHHLGEALTIDYICECLWPYEDYDKQKKYFHTHLYNLRKAFEAKGLNEVIINHLGKYKVKTSLFSLDTTAYREKLHQFLEKEMTFIDFLEIQPDIQKTYLAGDDYLWAEPERNVITVKWSLILHKILIEVDLTEEKRKVIESQLETI